jgi:hypothetical protein
MHVLPSLKTFRLLLIALLAVALTGGIAFVKASPAAAAEYDAAISLEVNAMQKSQRNQDPTGTPIYVRGTGLQPFSQLTVEVTGDQLEFHRLWKEYVDGSINYEYEGSYAQVVPANGNAVPRISFPNTQADIWWHVTLHAFLQPDEFEGCPARTYGYGDDEPMPVLFVEALIGERFFTDSLGRVTKARGDDTDTRIRCTYADSSSFSSQEGFPTYKVQGGLMGILFGGVVGGAEATGATEEECTALAHSEGKC